MELLEREELLAELGTALSAARAKNGRIALVSGEAGIGKSSLVRVFTRRYERAVRVYWGVCDALFTPRPLGPLHDVASQMGGELAELLASEAPPSAVFSSVLAGLQVSAAILVFEDVHWADEATLDLLRFLGRRVEQTSALLVLTYRDDELGQRHPLRGLLGDLVASPAARRIALQPLSQAAVRKLVGDRALDAAALHRQTAGNPFYVTEVLSNPTDQIPATVRDAVLARASRLSDSGYAVLEAAAVIGQRVPPWLLSVVTGGETRAAEECMAVGILLAQGDELVFRHELARETILESVSPPRKQALHRMVLDALSSAPASRNDLNRLVHHAQAAGDREAILAHAPEAARRASAAGAHRGAAALFELVLQHAEELPVQARAQLWDEYSVECDFIDQRPAAIASRRRAAALWEQAGNPLKYGKSLGMLALLLHLVGEGEEAERVNDRAIRTLEVLPPNRELVLVYNSQAVLALARLENRRGVELAERAITLIDRLQEDELLPRLYETLGLCWLHLDHPKGIELLQRSLSEGLELGQTARIANSYANLGSVFVEFHRLEEAEDCLETGLAYATERDLEFARLYMLAWQAQLLLHRGRWREAEQAAGEVLQFPGASIGSRGPALMARGRLRARRGEPGVDAALDESLELLFRLGFRQREGLVRAARAEAAWLAGDPERTRAEASAVYELAVSQRHPWVAGELALWRWKAGERVEVPGWMARPYALHLTGDWLSAAEEWERLGCPYERARALADGDAQAQLTALEIFEGLAAQPDADRLRETLQDAGVSGLLRRPRDSTRENPFGLTDRQVDVLALLVEGLTNAEIGERLHISPKTAEHHVSAILARLDVPSREQAAEQARKHPSFSQD